MSDLYTDIMTPFRSHHLIQFLEEWDGALDFSLAQYFKKHKALGSKDRGAIAEVLYSLIRWQRLIDYTLQGKPTWEKRVTALTKLDLKKMTEDESIPESIRASLPEALYETLKGSFGQNAFKIALELNLPAPTTLRINPDKTSRDALIEELKEFSPEPTLKSPLGITLKKKGALFGLESFKAGKFEMQDEASQLVGLMVQAKPGDRVLDFCAGSGGKTLAFAHKLKGQGQIYLHDIRKGILFEAKKRLRRAGIQNSQIIHFTEENKFKGLKGFFDWILVDAPCSGSGTYRRNPDMKEKFTLEMLDNLVQEQRAIFEKALTFLKPKGRIVYATCSLFKEENENQIDFFLKEFNLELDSEVFKSVPKRDQMDGLFAAVMKRKTSL